MEKKILLIRILFFFFISSAIAFCLSELFPKKITLNNGTVLEGKIIDGSLKDDEYIRIKWGNQLLTFSTYDIKSINGVPLKIPRWLEWKKETDIYTRKIDTVIDDYLKTMSKLIGDKLTINNPEYELTEPVKEEALTHLSDKINELIILSPPLGLDEFHKKTIESCKYFKISVENILAGDLEGYLEISNKALILRIESINAIKQSFTEHDVPYKHIAELGFRMEGFKKEINDNNDIADYLQGLDYASEGDFDKAADNFIKVKDKEKLSYLIGPQLKLIYDFYNNKVEKDYVLFYFRAQKYVKDGYIEKAIAELKKAIQINPKYDYYISLELASLYNSLNEFSTAKNYLESLIEINPDLPEAYIALGATYVFLKDDDQAKNNFYKAKELLEKEGDFKTGALIENFMKKHGYIDKYAIALSQEKHNLHSDSYNIKPKTIENDEYVLYIPSRIDGNIKYPLVVAFSPNADAKSMVNTWRDIAEEKKWYLYASKTFRNGTDVIYLFSKITNNLNTLFVKYPIDKSKIIITGMSGGGMGAHFFSYFYPELTKAIVINTGMMHEDYSDPQNYPKDKIAVFLASPTDFRYEEMISDETLLKSLGWQTKWIEFEGGHITAPTHIYQQTADWLENKLNQP